MLVLIIKAFIHLSWFIQAIQCGVCPSPEQILPCICDPRIILCNGNGKNINLGEIFETISTSNVPGQQQFEVFVLYNTSIEALPDGVFHGVQFNDLQFDINPKLTCVHPNAFGGNTRSITTSIITENTSFATINATCNFIKALSKLNNMRYIDIMDSDVEEIPEYGIEFIKYDGWVGDIQIHFGPKKRSIGSLKTIRSNAYTDSKGDIGRIGLTHNQISTIESNAFNFTGQSDFTLQIFLQYNNLSGDSFGDNAFNVGNRTTKIILSSNPKLKYLKENVFYPFLGNKQNKNQLSLLMTPLDYYQENLWLFQYRLTDKILNARMVDGIDLWQANVNKFTKTVENSTTSN